MLVIVKNSRVLKTLFICFAVILMIYCQTVLQLSLRLSCFQKTINSTLQNLVGWSFLSSPADMTLWVHLTHLRSLHRCVYAAWSVFWAFFASMKSDRNCRSCRIFFLSSYPTLLCRSLFLYCSYMSSEIWPILWRKPKNNVFYYLGETVWQTGCWVILSFRCLLTKALFPQ